MHSFSVIPRQASYIFIFPITIIVFRSMWLGVLTSKHTDRYMLLLFFIGITNWILGMYFADTLSRWVEYIPSLLSSANREIIFLVALTYFFFQKRIFNAFLFVFIFFLFLTIVVGGTLEGILTELVNTKTAVTDWGFGLGVLKTGTGFTLMLLFLMIYLVLPGRFLALFAATIMVSLSLIHI